MVVVAYATTMAADLTPFGFTTTESLVYTTLLRLGPVTGYAVARDPPGVAPRGDSGPSRAPNRRRSARRGPGARDGHDAPGSSHRARDRRDAGARRRRLGRRARGGLDLAPRHRGPGPRRPWRR